MFKVGDKIKIRKDLEEDKVYGGVDVVRPMYTFLGKEATITDVDDDGHFLLDIDSEYFYWSAEMFEPKADSEEAFTLEKKVTLDKVLTETVHEDALNRLSKAVIEYENIVHELESEVDYYETKYTDLVEKYNVLVEKHNSLLEELKEDYIQ